MLGRNLFYSLLTIMTILGINVTHAASITVPMFLVADEGQGESIGTIKIEDTTCGVLLKPDLHKLPPGLHGFHIHEHPSCNKNGMDAGNHLDPQSTDKHQGPFDDTGHLGDLPFLVVNHDGTATLPSNAPRIKLDQLKGHALMIHQGGDNYSDRPDKNGGGGARIACGVIDLQ